MSKCELLKLRNTIDFTISMVKENYEDLVEKKIIKDIEQLREVGRISDNITRHFLT